MKRQRLYGPSESSFPIRFFLLVFLLSVPIWSIGPVVERALPHELPVKLPVSSLMALVPVAAAAILSWRQGGWQAVRILLRRAFDYKRIRKKIWYVPVILLNPAVMVLQYGLMALVGALPPEPQVPLLMVMISFLVFFVAGLAEELGWQGYAIERLQGRWNTLTASVILGSIWAVWHVVPMIQLGQAPAWIAWQCASMVVGRILLVWLYQNTGKSVFAAVLCHAMNNVTTVLLATYGWPYDPMLATVVMAIMAAAVTLLWGSQTLARYRYARPGQGVGHRTANAPVPGTGS